MEKVGKKFMTNPQFYPQAKKQYHHWSGGMFLVHRGNFVMGK
jgi:hypothetical protein